MQTPSRSVVAAALLAAGALAIGVAFAVDFHKSPSAPTGVLLIVGCWLVIAGYGRRERRGMSAPERQLPTVLIHLLAAAIFGAALVCAATVAIFGQYYASERLCYVLVALVVTPTAVIWTQRVVDASSERAAFRALSVLTVTAVALLVCRLSRSGHTSLLLSGLLLLGPIAVALGSLLPARLITLAASRLVGVVPLILAVAALAFAPAGAVSPIRLCVAVAVALAAGLAVRHAHPSAGSRARLGADAVVLVVVALAVCELSRLNPTRAFNMNYFLGPTNDVLHGRPMLIDTFAQYGVGIFYALAGLFSILPLGYGTFSLVLGVGTALLFACIYLLLRRALGSQLIAIAGVICVAFVYMYSVGNWQYLDFPSTGVLRFGIPWLAVLSTVAAGGCTGHRQKGLRGCTLILVATAAAWSAETCMYTSGCACAMALLEASSLDAPRAARLRSALRRLLVVAGSAAVGILVLTGVLLVSSGQMPDWGPYISFVRLYTLSGFGLLPIEHWSQGIALGALYGSSAALVCGLLVISPQEIRSRMSAFHAIAGVTAMGALEFTYFLGRAAPSNLIWVSPPAVALLFLWLGTSGNLLGRQAPRVTTTTAVALLATLLVLGADPYTHGRFKETALGSVLTGNPSLTSAISRLAANRLVFQPSAMLVQLIESKELASRPLALIAYPSVETEALIRARRANNIESSNPCQSALSLSAPNRVLKEVTAFRPGGTMVLYTRAGMPLVPLQMYELKLLRARFEMRRIASGLGLGVFRLERIRPSWHGGYATRWPGTPSSGHPGCA